MNKIDNLKDNKYFNNYEKEYTLFIDYIVHVMNYKGKEKTHLLQTIQNWEKFYQSQQDAGWFAPSDLLEAKLAQNDKKFIQKCATLETIEDQITLCVDMILACEHRNVHDPLVKQYAQYYAESELFGLYQKAKTSYYFDCETPEYIVNNPTKKEKLLQQQARRREEIRLYRSWACSWSSGNSFFFGKRGIHFQVADQGDGKVELMELIHGAPNAQQAIYLIETAMTFGRGKHESCIPLVIVFSNRFECIFDEIEKHLKNYGVMCRLEEKNTTIRICNENGTECRGWNHLEHFVNEHY